MEAADVDALRAVGLEDRDVLQLCEVVAYYAYANRIADGLGVTLEDEEPGSTRSGPEPRPPTE